MDDRKFDMQEKLTDVRQDLLELIAQFKEEDWGTIVYSEGKEWTVADVLRHISNAEASMTRLCEVIRDGGEGVSEDFDLDRWNNRVVEKAQSKTPSTIVDEMVRNRIELFGFVEALQPEDWSKSGRHGSMKIMTIEQILNRIADHEVEHTEDIRRFTKRK